MWREVRGLCSAVALSATLVLALVAPAGALEEEALLLSIAPHRHLYVAGRSIAGGEMRYLADKEQLQVGDAIVHLSTAAPDTSRGWRYSSQDVEAYAAVPLLKELVGSGMDTTHAIQECRRREDAFSAAVQAAMSRPDLGAEVRQGTFSPEALRQGYENVIARVEWKGQIVFYRWAMLGTQESIVTMPGARLPTSTERATELTSAILSFLKTEPPLVGLMVVGEGGGYRVMIGSGADRAMAQIKEALRKGGFVDGPLSAYQVMPIVGAANQQGDQ